MQKPVRRSCDAHPNGLNPRGLDLAEWTGLEPATPGVTGRYSNQLNYHSSTSIKQESVGYFSQAALSAHVLQTTPIFWRPLGDSNPCTHRERVMS
jgi:hypothetical protein